VLSELARVAARKCDTARTVRLVRQAPRFSLCLTKAVNRLAKFLALGTDPNGEEAHDHAGIDALLQQIGVWGRIMVHRNLSSLLFQTNAVRESLGFFDSVHARGDAEMVERLQAKFGKRGLHDGQTLLALGPTQAGALTNAEKSKVKLKKMSDYRRV
jgi:hypothetical protein